MTQDVPDHLTSGLRLVIVGINPGLKSGAAGHHYAHPGNHFWKLLYRSGLIGEPLSFAEDHRALEYGIGLTNLCDRTSREATELTREEMRAGAESLRVKLRACRPRAVCFNGMSIYEAFSGRRRITPGLQPERLEEMLLFVVPSSSGRTAAYPLPAKLRLYEELKTLLDSLPVLEAAT